MGDFAAYIDSVRQHAGRRLWHATALVIAGAVVEGFGIVAILPFASLFTGEAHNRPAKIALRMLDAAGLDTRLERALAIVAVFVLLLAVRNVIMWRREIYLGQLGMDFVDHWRSRLFRSIGAAPWSQITGMRRTDLEHTITADVMRLASGTDQLLKSGVNIALIAVQLAILFALAPLLVVLIAALMLIGSVLARPLIRRARKLGKGLSQSGRAMHRVLGNFLASQKLARLSDAQSDFTARFEDAITEMRAQQMDFKASQAAARGWFQFIGGCLIAAALLLGFFVLGVSGTILLVTLVILARMINPVVWILQTSQFVANMLPAFRHVREIEAALLAESRETPPMAAKAPGSGPAALTLRNVRFRYPGQSEWLVDGVSFAVEPGEIVALDAPSGRGKTTVLDLAAGLFSAQEGEVVIDGRVLESDRDWRAWRSRLAYLPQDPFLFDASLRENLTWSAPDASDEAIREALGIAEATGIVENLKHGLETRTGERGTSLSGGERQRICLARGLLRSPDFMILDEATNALDRELEARILERLRGMRDRFSLLLVTHRAEALRFADRVVTL